MSKDRLPMSSDPGDTSHGPETAHPLAQPRLAPEPGMRVRYLEGELEAQRRHLAESLAGFYRTISDLKTELAAAKARVDQLEHESSEKKDRPAEMDAERLRLSTELGEARQTLQGERREELDLLGQVEAMQASTSWRITAPLRALGALLRRRS